ncbi:MAG: 3-hydroxyacyl-CoA dehydrogenase, partial [Cyanobacteria bacterium]|nr:3-hydroxyacyl-CoA dehydrogenase [Cyanobacteriota bacterium]
MQVTNVGVVGAGTMGASITVALLSHGFPVMLKEANEDLLAKGLDNINRIQLKRIDKGLDPAKAKEELDRIQTT